MITSSIKGRLRSCSRYKVFVVPKGVKSFSTKLTTCAIENINSTKEIAIIPVLADNYSYLIMDHNTKNGIVVDPADATKIYKTASEFDIDVVAILNTHKHDDHVCGNLELQNLLLENNNEMLTPIYGPDDAGPTPGCTNIIKGGDVINIDSFSFNVISTPCHTKGHVTFFSNSSSTPILFPGDTIFLAGCGRFFEGTGKDMYDSLNRIKEFNIPLNTQIFCGHEYSLSNLAYAQSVEPTNIKLFDKLRWVIKQRNDNLPTVPSTWEEELSYNPFLRLEEPEIQTSVNALHDDSMEDIMSKVRLGKDNYDFDFNHTVQMAYSNKNGSRAPSPSCIYDYEPNLNIASYERTTPIVFLISEEDKKKEKYISLVKKVSNLGFFSREIVFSHETILNKEARKNGAKKDNLVKSCIASLFTNTTDLTPPIVIAEGIFGFVAQKYLESYALSGLCLLNTFPPNPSNVVIGNNGDWNNDGVDDTFINAITADALLPERQLNLESNVLPIYSVYIDVIGNSNVIVDEFVKFHNLDYDEDIRIFSGNSRSQADNNSFVNEVEDSFCSWLDERF
jgi:hydroxyacylglutathione hydrolase